MQIWSSNRILHNLIRRMWIRNSWKRIFPPTLQHFGDMRVRILCFLARSGMIFGPSSDFGGSCHSVFIETLDQLILAVWCVDCERKCGILIPRRSPSLCTRSQRKWMRSTGRRARKSHRTLMLQRVHLLANALCAVNLEIWAWVRWYLYRYASNLHWKYVWTFKTWWIFKCKIFIKTTTTKLYESFFKIENTFCKMKSMCSMGIFKISRERCCKNGM